MLLYNTVVFVLKHLYYLIMFQPTGFKPGKVQFREFSKSSLDNYTTGKFILLSFNDILI